MSNASFPASGSSAWAYANPHGPIMWSIGPDKKTKYIIQQFSQNADDWEIAPMSIPYSAGGVHLPQYYLVAESDPQLVGKVAFWLRTYAPIFPDYETPEQAAVRFPTLGSGGSVFARPAQTISTHTTLRSKFFLLGISRQDTYPYGLVTSFGDIPMLAPLPPVTSAGWGETYVDATNETLSHPEFFPDNTARTTADGQGDETGETRTQTEYETMVTNRWQVVCEESVLRQQWPGSDLWERVTRYTRAQ